MPDPVPSLSPGLLLWAFVLLTPVAMTAATLSALLERSGPIRLRHWAEEAGGSLRKVSETPVRFGVFRYLLSLLSRTLPIILAVLLTGCLIRFHRAHPTLWAFGVVLLLVAATEAVNRALVGQDPERALRTLTRVYRVALWLLSPLVRLLTPFVPAEAFARHEEGEDDAASDEEIEAFIDVGTREGILEPQEGEWLWGIVGFGDTQARSVMTPRIDLVCAP
ncbi:MAG TPA: CNNM domain-containing protein, partial [Thermoanaerobaculia bacterium]